MKKLQKVKRYRDILNILMRNGFGFLLERIGFASYFIKNEKKENISKELSYAVRLRKAIEELGPTFIKFGQILSTREDLLPREYIIELKKLQDQVKPISIEKIKKVIEEAIGHSIENAFLEFDYNPIATASISQVYKGKLFTREEVVIKVQRPEIKKNMDEDIGILFDLVKVAVEKIPNLRVYDFVGIIEEFKKSVEKELDFTIEARNIEKYHQHFGENSLTYIPNVFWEYTSTRVITMEYIDGIKINSMEDLKRFNINREILAQNLINILLKQVFEHGFFHADPHPGNILVLRDGKIAFIDFGIMGKISKSDKLLMADLLLAVIQKDEEKIANIILKMGEPAEEIHLIELIWDIEEILDMFYGKTLKDIQFSKLIEKLLKAALYHKIGIPKQYILLSKSILTVEGVARELDDKFNIIEAIEPYARKMVFARYKPNKLILNLINDFILRINYHKDIFYLSKVILDKAAKDQLKIQFEIKDLNQTLFSLNRMMNRLSISIIIASLLIGISFVLRTGTPSKYGSFIGIGGFVGVAILGLLLLYSMVKDHFKQ